MEAEQGKCGLQNAPLCLPKLPRAEAYDNAAIGLRLHFGLIDEKQNIVVRALPEALA